MKTVRDLILYVVIGFAFVGGVIWFNDYQFRHLWSVPNADKLWRYGAGAIFTCYVFGFLISNNREQWRVRRVWMLWSALLVVHAVAWARYLLAADNFGRLPIGFYAIVAFLEVIFFNWLTQIAATLPSKLSQ